MNRMVKGAVIVSVALLAATTHGSDRNANRIERLELQGGSLKEGDRYTLGITSESVLRDSGQAWALRSALGGGLMEPDNGSEHPFFYGEIGLKHYLTTLTAVSLTGGYSYQDRETGHDNIWSLNLYGRQRLLNAVEPISPYLELRASLRRLDAPNPNAGGRKSSNDLVLTALAGLEIRMRHDFSIMLEGGGTQSEAFSGGRQRADGIFAAIAMQYYWD